MKQFEAHVLLIAILVISSTNAFDDSKTQPTSQEPTDYVEEDEESAELFPALLQDNYRNGFIHLIEFFRTTNSTLTKLRDKLDDLENKIEVLNTALLKTGVETKTNTDNLKQEIASLKKILSTDRTSHSQQIQTLKSQIEILKKERDAEVNELRSSWSSKLNQLERTNSKMTSALFERNPEAFLESLPSPKNGKSFNGSTFEAISAAVPTRNMLVVQTKNYLDVDLTEYQLHLPFGFGVASAPNNISAKTAEVATFVYEATNAAAQQEMSYRIEGTDISLHVYFVNARIYKTFAAALFPRSSPAKYIVPLDCANYNHSGTAGSRKCITKVGAGEAKTLTVFEGDIFLKVTYETKFIQRPGTLTCEVFKLTI